MSSKRHLVALLLAVVACSSAGANDGGSSQAALSMTDPSASSDGGSSGDGATSSDTDASTQTARIAQVVARTNLVSDQSGASRTDLSLVNAWGLSFAPAGFAWVSTNGSGIANTYDVRGGSPVPAVTIPSPSDAAETSTPTGSVVNRESSAFSGDSLIFVTEDGTVAGWNSSDQNHAVIRADRSGAGALYKGVAIASVPNGRPRLFAANFAAGTVDVFDDTYAPVTARGGFKDANLPSGFAPFNVVEVEGGLIVTYAKQDEKKEDDVKGIGNGFIDLFDPNGVLISRLVSGGMLNSPWGVAVAPPNFGNVPYRLLVGNFGDGHINVYGVHNPSSLAELEFEGVLGDANGGPLTIDGLWALRFGNDVAGFASNQLFFTAGPNDESHGVFGRLDAASP